MVATVLTIFLLPQSKFRIISSIVLCIATIVTIFLAWWVDKIESKEIYIRAPTARWVLVVLFFGGAIVCSSTCILISEANLGFGYFLFASFCLIIIATRNAANAINDSRKYTTINLPN